MDLKALIIGIDSTIGQELAKSLKASNCNVFGTTRHPQRATSNIFYVDLDQTHTIANIANEHKFDVIYSCAAITNMEACEHDYELSKRINLDAQIALAKHCINKTNIYIFLSTAGVFDGSVPMRTTDTPPAPKCNYGHHKMLAEQFLLNFSEKIIIVRTTKVLSKNNKLINDWASSLQNNQPIEPFFDMRLSPVSIEALITLLTNLAKNKHKPIVHISGENDILYSDMAIIIAKLLNKPTSLIKSRSYTTAGLSTNTVLSYSSLDMTETTKHYGLQPQPIIDILKNVLNISP